MSTQQHLTHETGLPQGYKIRSLHLRNRKLTLDKLTTDEIYSRVYQLRDSNPEKIVSQLRVIDAEMEAVEKTLHALRVAREEELRRIDIDLADWNANELLKAGLRRMKKTGKKTFTKQELIP